MDRITKTLLETFVAENSLSKLTEDRAFEYFCGSLATEKHYSEAFDPEALSVGSGNDSGIDCIAIVVNGALVTDIEQLEDMRNGVAYLDISFVFVQAERSSSFDGSKIGNFVYGVIDFLDESPKLKQNERVAEYAIIAKRIYDLSAMFKKGNPQCFLYYMTTGKWVGDNNLEARRASACNDVMALSLFRSVAFECIGSDGIQKLSRESQNAIETEVLFSKRAVVPETAGVDQAFVGVLPSSEFLKLIQTESGEIRPSLFYDNVRHWQEWNAVNEEIRDTLMNKDQRQLFPFLNNGVTIVAKRVNPTGDRFLIEDYQIVNGCQTSYVLHACKAEFTEDIYIPVRLIATENEDVRNAIIKATNRQTEVTDEQLFALSEFPKKLEGFFPSFPGDRKLYYERRSRQYNGIEGIEKVRIMTMTTVVRAFASMFLDSPHRTTRNYRSLLKEIGKDIFASNHRYEPYYAAALAHYRLDFMFRNSHLPSTLKPARYHILFAARLILHSQQLPKMNSNEMGRLCESFCQDALWDDAKGRHLLFWAADIVEQACAGDFHRDTIRTEVFTNRLKDVVLAIKAKGQ